MDVDFITLSEVSHSEKDISCMWNIKKKKKKIPMSFLQNSNKLTDVENNCIVSKLLRQSGGINKELGINIYTLLYMKYIAFII